MLAHTTRDSGFLYSPAFSASQVTEKTAICSYVRICTVEENLALMKIESRPPQPNPAPKHEPGPTRQTDGNDMLLRSKKKGKGPAGERKRGGIARVGERVCKPEAP